MIKNIIIFGTPKLMERGLQHRRPIEGDTLFVFPFVEEGSLFHSRNVAEPFDLAFISETRRVLKMSTITPPEGTSRAPVGSHMALEAKAGRLSAWGFLPGRTVDF